MEKLNGAVLFISTFLFRKIQPVPISDFYLLQSGFDSWVLVSRLHYSLMLSQMFRGSLILLGQQINTHYLSFFPYRLWTLLYFFEKLAQYFALSITNWYLKSQS
jgi:hypothetical protein